MMEPANRTDLKVASILYYQLFEEEFPERDYTNQDIKYIIEKLGLYRDSNIDLFSSDRLH